MVSLLPQDSQLRAQFLDNKGWILDTLAHCLPNRTLPFITILTHRWSCLTLNDIKVRNYGSRNNMTTKIS